MKYKPPSEQLSEFSDVRFWNGFTFGVLFVTIVLTVADFLSDGKADHIVIEAVTVVCTIISVAINKSKHGRDDGMSRMRAIIRNP